MFHFKLKAVVGILVYWQMAMTDGQQSGFELLGSLTTEQPSQVFRTGWAEHDQLMSIGPGVPVSVTIGISVEPMDRVRNLATSTSAKKRPLIAQKIGQDLFNFMQSFDTGTAGGSHMVVPKSIFERWWQRFERKSERDHPHA